jgi:hypothetical protein
VADAPFAYVNAFKEHVNVGFFQGSELRDPGGLLKGTGKSMRHVKLLAREPVEEAELETLIDLAYQNIRSRLAEEPGWK